MRLLLDQGIPRTTVLHLRHLGIESVHVGNRGLAAASDATILDIATEEQRIVVTLDADFHALVALSGAPGPSVIRIRLEGLDSEHLSALLSDVLKLCEKDLEAGAMVSITDHGVRVRRLPLLR